MIPLTQKGVALNTYWDWGHANRQTWSICLIYSLLFSPHTFLPPPHIWIAGRTQFLCGVVCTLAGDPDFLGLGRFLQLKLCRSDQFMILKPYCSKPRASWIVTTIIERIVWSIVLSRLNLISPHFPALCMEKYLHDVNMLSETLSENLKYSKLVTRTFFKNTYSPSL